MAKIFNPPPTWPAPPAGWSPEPGWRPDPAWGPAPEGWELWIAAPRRWYRKKRFIPLWVFLALLVVGVTADPPQEEEPAVVAAAAEREASIPPTDPALNAQQEAARLAAEQEAARVAAEQKAARAAEAARVAAEQEAARVPVLDEAAVAACQVLANGAQDVATKQDRSDLARAFNQYARQSSEPKIVEAGRFMTDSVDSWTGFMWDGSVGIAADVCIAGGME